MNRLALLGSILVLAACTAGQNNALYILHNQALPADKGCTIPSDSSLPYLGFGSLDVAAGDPYLFTPLVQNGAIANMDDPNAHIVFLQGADIELQASTTPRSQQLVAALAAASLDKRTQRFSGSISAGGTLGILYPLIDVDQSSALTPLLAAGERVQLIAHTTLFGQVDNGDITSAPFDYPITVCAGCLYDVLGTCPLPKGTTVQPGFACGTLQDAFVDCCSTTTGGTICPATVSTI